VDGASRSDCFTPGKGAVTVKTKRVSSCKALATNYQSARCDVLKNNAFRHDSYSSSNIVRTVKWAGHVARIKQI
jgi:hypothetical protein